MSRLHVKCNTTHINNIVPSLMSLDNDGTTRITVHTRTHPRVWRVLLLHVNIILLCYTYCYTHTRTHTHVRAEVLPGKYTHRILSIRDHSSTDFTLTYLTYRQQCVQTSICETNVPCVNWLMATQSKKKSRLYYYVF